MLFVLLCCGYELFVVILIVIHTILKTLPLSIHMYHNIFIFVIDESLYYCNFMSVIFNCCCAANTYFITSSILSYSIYAATPARRTPRATPKGFETPTGGPTATPTHASASSGDATPASASAHASASSASSSASDSAPSINLDLPLDKFIEKHTSEDDASYPTT